MYSKVLNLHQPKKNLPSKCRSELVCIVDSFVAVPIHKNIF